MLSTKLTMLMLIFIASLHGYTIPVYAKTAHQQVQTSINLNKADTKQLNQLKGIGKSKAQAIVNYRKAHGAFKSVDELAKVKGFSKRLVKRLKAKLSV